MICFTNSPTVSATLLNPRAYTYQYRTITTRGAFFSSTYGQEDLIAPSTNKSIGFINKEMWVFLNDNEWIETGATKGPVSNSLQTPNPGSSNKSYWQGHFVAYKLYNSSANQYEYHEVAYGSQNPTGTHNFSITYIGSNTWVVYSDYARVLTISPVPYSSSKYVQVGIETNETTSSFLSGTFASNWQLKDTNDIWHLSTMAVNGDSNNLNWSSSFSYNSSNSTNLIRYSHP